MKLALLTMLAALVLTAGGLIAIQPAEAQLPSGCDYVPGQSLYTKRAVWDEDRQTWVVREFICTSDNEWMAIGWAWHDFNSTEKPDGWHSTGRFDRNGFPVIQSTGESPVATSSEGYWDPDVSRQIDRGSSQLVYAGSICSSLQSGDLTGSSINPAHVYRVGNGWHYIEDEDDRAAFGRPDARMSSIWGYRTEFQDHDNDPSTPQQGVRVPSIASCASE